MNNEKPQINNFPKFIIAIFLFVVGIWVGRNVALPFLPSDNPRINVLNRLYTKDNVDFSTFWQVWDQLNSTYLNKKNLNGQKLLQGAISGLVSAAGDPYTLYFNPEANKAFTDQLSGSFDGVGIELTEKNNQLTVIAPLDGSPAAKAGVLAGDEITAINGKDTSTMSIGDAVTAIRGQTGTKVKLTLMRSGHKEPFDLELTRATITVKTVKVSIKDGIATVSISQFGDNTQSEWDSAVTQITSQGIKKIILDLRNDPGGRLDTAIHVAGDFLKTTDVVLQEEDSDGNRQSFNSDQNGHLQGTKVVILINKGSASASEIVTGALTDHKIAQTVGETSFGKGVVQSVTNLSDGSGLHITIAKWLTPNGTWIQGKGFTPDFPVTRTEADINIGRDPQMDKALELLK